LLFFGVSEGARMETGLLPPAVAPEEFSNGVTDAPLQPDITPAAKFEVMVHEYEPGSLAPATW